MRDRDNAKEGKDFVWVDMKDSKGNIVKDGFGNAVKTRKFGAKAEAPAASPKPKAKPAAKKPVSATASAAPTKSIRPKAKPTSNTASVSAVSGASRGTTGKSATRLARLKKESAMQMDRSAVKLGMTLRERNQK